MGTTTKNWSDGQIKQFVASVRKRVGNGWEWLTPDVRHALVAEKALAIVCAQDRATVEVDAVTELLTRMLTTAGLEQA